MRYFWFVLSLVLTAANIIAYVLFGFPLIFFFLFFPPLFFRKSPEDVHTCPRCNMEINPFWVYCPSCGLDLRMYEEDTSQYI